MSLDAAASEEGSPVRNDPKAMAIVCAVCVALLISPRAQGQGASEKISYGANPEAGRYLCVDDAKIYYEAYGSGGTPLVLLHGGFGPRAVDARENPSSGITCATLCQRSGTIHAYRKRP
jgi:hypothetical protein